MRLDFRNIGKGLEAIAGAKQARDLAQESARYDVTEGAYGPGLQENIQQLQGLREQDPAQAPAYDQAITELTRRQGLTAPDFSVASGPTNFATRQEARQAAAPMRAEGLAGVYRQYGDIAKADELEARAFDQQRGLAAEERAKAAEGRAVAADARAQQDFATGQTEKGLRINQLTRTEAEQQRASDFSNFAAENPNMPVAELKDAAFKQFKFSPKQWQETVTTRLGIENAEMDSFKNNVKKKLQGKNLSQLGALYNSDPDFDDKTDLAIIPGKGGAVTLNFIDKASGRVTSTQSFKNEALATEYLNKQATEPETIGSWMMNLQKAEVGLDKDRAAAEASRATVGLKNTQMKMFTDQAAASDEAQQIRARFMALSDEDQAGPKGLALRQAFTMANAKAGAVVPLGAAPRAERPALTEAEVTNRAEKYVSTRQKNPDTGKVYTLDEAIERVRGTPPAPGTPAAAKASLDAVLGGGGDPFATPAAGGGAPRQPKGLTSSTAAPAPARNAPVEPNPYVDARGRPLAVYPAGAPSYVSTAIPAAAAAVEGAVGTQATATRYLQAKIARNEPLTPAERARAVQMGIIR